jgi:hypothetical protein
MRTATGLVLGAFVVLWALGASGDVTEDWVRTYEGPGGGHDWARAIAMDDSGNVYATGASDMGAHRDLVVVKYDPDGNERWAETYDGTAGDYDYGYDIIFRDGYVYAAGQSAGAGTDQDYVAVKYTRGGTEEWAARYNGPTDGRDSAYALAIDDSGNVYVTGESDGGVSGYDMLTVKYRPDGVQQWERRYVGTPGNPGLGTDIALDDLANVYVTGYADSSRNGRDCVTVKYTRGGAFQWAAGCDCTDDYDYWRNSVAVDPDGYPVIAVAAPTDTIWDDYLVIRYTPGGAVDWSTKYEGGAGDMPRAMTIDDSGCVYVTGWSSNDCATVKFGPDGTERWAEKYSGRGRGFDEANAIALDKWANVYVTGESQQGAGPLERDIFTIRYGPGGSEDWVAMYGGAAGEGDVGWGIVAGDDGSVYVAGKSREAAINDDMVVIKYVQDTPVEGHFRASTTEAGGVLLEWSIPALAGVRELNVYRATLPDGPFARVNDEPLGPVSPGRFEDTTVWPETTFWYELRAVLVGGAEDVVEPGLARVTTGGRLSLALSPPHPNPSGGIAAFSFDVPNGASPVKLAVYNVRGERVKTLVDGLIGRGRHERHWDGTDEAGRAVAAGAYFVRLENAGAAKTQKLVLVR